MLGFASFAEIPFAVAQTSAILVLSLAETTTVVELCSPTLITNNDLVDSTDYFAENDGQRGLFFTIEEITSFEEAVSPQVAFVTQVVDSASLFEVMSTIATYNVPVVEQNVFIEAYPTTVVYNVPLVDEFSLYDELFGRKLWEQIENAENASWTQINSAQATTWATIDTPQSPGWTDITDV